MALQMVRLTEEATYNVFNPSMTPPQLLLFLPMGDACTVQKMPQYEPIRDAGVGNRMIRRILGRYEVKGSIKTFLFPSQASLLTSWAATLVNSSPCLDLKSFTVDRAIFLDQTCTPIRQRSLGCKIDKFELTADNSDNSFLLNVNMDIIGSKYDDTITGSDFPTPSYSSYPTDNPFEFYQLAAGVSGIMNINGARTNFQSFMLSINNMLQPFPDENLFPSYVGWFGRDVTWSARTLYKSAADRVVWNTGALVTVEAKFNNGTHAVDFNLQASNSYTSVVDSLPIDNFFTQTVSGQSLLDQSSDSDLAITVT